MRYPEVFGYAGVFSPAFWTNMSDLKKEINTNNSKWSGNSYMITGELEGERYINNMYEIKDMLLRKGIQNIHTEVVPNGRHNEIFWRSQFPNFLKSISLTR
jgi:predicted alpha/beta superfamily hydrolase